MDELDHQLRRPVTRGGLAAEQHGARRGRSPRLTPEPLPERDHVQHVQVLALVLVDPLHLHVEQAIRVAGDARARLDYRREVRLVGALDLAPLGREGRVPGQRLELVQPLELARPAVPDGTGDQAREPRVRERQEAPGRHAVRDVRPRRHSSWKSRSTSLFSSSVCSAATPLMRSTADARQVGHPQRAAARLVDQAEPRHAPRVARVAALHLVEEAPVDLVDDVEVARQHAPRTSRPATFRAPRAAACGWCSRRSGA